MLLLETQLKDIVPDQEIVTAIGTIITPSELLLQLDFEKPNIIRPDVFQNFNSLLALRHKIKNLELVPIKDKEMHDNYNALDKQKLVEELKKHF